MQNDNVSIESFYRNLAFIWIALFTSQFIIASVVFVIEPGAFRFDFAKPILGKNSIVIVIFAFAAIINLVLSIALKKKFLAQAVTDQNIYFVQTAMIVGCALCEVVSLLGLMLALVAQYQYFFIWIALGILGMIFHFPIRENLIKSSYKKHEVV